MGVAAQYWVSPTFPDTGTTPEYFESIIGGKYGTRILVFLPIPPKRYISIVVNLHFAGVTTNNTKGNASLGWEHINVLGEYKFDRRRVHETDYLRPLNLWI